ncbi:MAG: hypothetical protein HY814_05620 [Candidatus Riflebacteria bacterium]|nr:hypothetical protein [Candidatus Riflebacteria bacterium]
MFRFVILTICFALATGTAVFALTPALEVVDRQLGAEATRLDGALTALGRLAPEDLAAMKGGLPEIFKTFQTGYFAEHGKYMSEDKNVRLMLKTIEGLRKELGSKGEGLTVTDFSIALHRSSPDARRSSANGALVLDTIYNNDILSDPPDLLRMLETRRLFSDLNMALSQRAYLDKPQEPRTQGKPPVMARVLATLVSKFPGERGKAIRDTLDLMGIQDLTASIFVRHATERLKDPAMGDRLDRFHTALLQRLKTARANPGEAAGGPDLWQLAQEVAGDPIGAVELIGVFTTQHRTLAKTILPLLPSREAQIPYLVPLIRCTANFFLVQELSEAVRGSGKTYTFPYPEGDASDDRRFYHFWSEAFIATQLRQKGHGAEVVKFVSANLGRAYETYTLPLNLKFAIKTHADAFGVLGGWAQDVQAHKRGSAFGSSVVDGLK